MKTAVMQPYFMPYIGYWQLMNAVDKFIIFDDVNYIKRGYINRNSILINGQAHLFTIPVKNASQNRLIKDMELSFSEKERVKFISQIEMAYKKAPLFSDVMPMMEDIIRFDTYDLTDFIMNSIRTINEYMNIETEILMASSIDKEKVLSGQERIIKICKVLNTRDYINPCGGRNLYDRENFLRNDINLWFLDTKFENIKYNQFNSEFVQRLSIIDLIMFNDKEGLRQFLGEYELNYE